MIATQERHLLRHVLTMALLITGGALTLMGLKIPIKAALADLLLDDAWQHAATTRQLVKPWPWLDSYPVARLKIPRLGVDQIILAGDSGAVLAFAPGLNDHFDAMGIAVISGHRDTHFNFMKNLDEGDLLRLERYDGNRSSYVVNRLFVVNSNSIQIDTSGAGHQALILITCWPVDSPVPGGEERWVVEAVRLR